MLRVSTVAALATESADAGATVTSHSMTPCCITRHSTRPWVCGVPWVAMGYIGFGSGKMSDLVLVSGKKPRLVRVSCEPHFLVLVSQRAISLSVGKTKHVSSTNSFMQPLVHSLPCGTGVQEGETQLHAHD